MYFYEKRNLYKKGFRYIVNSLLMVSLFLTSKERIPNTVIFNISPYWSAYRYVYHFESWVYPEFLFEMLVFGSQRLCLIFLFSYPGIIPSTSWRKKKKRCFVLMTDTKKWEGVSEIYSNLERKEKKKKKKSIGVSRKWLKQCINV